MMERGLSRPFLLFLLCSSASGLGSVVLKRYTYKHLYLTWTEAQSHCRSLGYNSDLAIVYMSDKDNINMEQFKAWIGLHLGTSGKWVWSSGASANIRWANSEPHDDDDCAYLLYSSRRHYGASCEKQYFFFCQEVVDEEINYRLIPQAKTWPEAHQYCINLYQDLATVESDDNLVIDSVPRDFPVWTGLHRNGELWKWTTGSMAFTHWAPNEPRNNNNNCVSISSLSKDMSTQNCSARFPFVCYRDNLVLVKENKTWEEALEHCRALRSRLYPHLWYDLVSVQPGTDHTFLVNKILLADTEEVWTGLHFLAGYWLWVNRAEMLYADFPDCPIKGQNCGALPKNDTGSVKTRDCTERRNFLCYTMQF